MFQDFVLQVVENKTIKEGVFENYIYAPVRRFFSFGYQQTEEQQLLNEKEEQQWYAEQKAKFDQMADSKDIYPGYDENQRAKKEYQELKDSQRQKYSIKH